MTFREGVFAQPENLRGAAAAMRDALAAANLARLREGTLVLSGIGASWHALVPAVRTLRAAGRRAFAVPAPDLADAPAARLADAFMPPPTGELAAPVLQILPVQLIVMRLAASRGLAIDGLRRQQDDTKLPTGKAA